VGGPFLGWLLVLRVVVLVVAAVVVVGFCVERSSRTDLIRAW
jgi:hypothetical protein